MSKLSAWEKRNKIRRGEPLEWNGLLFYPVTMSHYEEFLDVKNAWLARQSSFPVRYMAMPFLSAVWAMDVDFAKSDGKLIGLFERIIDIRELDYIKVTQGGNTVQITPADFAAYIRSLVAEQNGLTLPDESYNPELVQAEQELAAEQSALLKFDIDTMIASVAYLSHLDEREIDEWTVLKFERRRNAIERDKKYMLYAQAEMSGMVKFKHGNPYLSWCFDKAEGLSPVLRSTSDVNANVSAIGDINAAVAVGKPTQ